MARRSAPPGRPHWIVNEKVERRRFGFRPRSARPSGHQRRLIARPGHAPSGDRSPAQLAKGRKVYPPAISGIPTPVSATRSAAIVRRRAHARPPIRTLALIVNLSHCSKFTTGNAGHVAISRAAARIRRRPGSSCVGSHARHHIIASSTHAHFEWRLLQLKLPASTWKKTNALTHPQRIPAIRMFSRQSRCSVYVVFQQQVGHPHTRDRRTNFVAHVRSLVSFDQPMHSSQLRVIAAAPCGQPLRSRARSRASCYVPTRSAPAQLTSSARCNQRPYY